MIAPQDDEIERRAQSYEQRKLRVVPPRDSATHIADVEDTDTSDTRRFRFGIKNIDERGGALLPASMTLLAALTGKGKTVFAEQIAKANATDYSVLYATFEQTGIEIRDSMVARDMGLSLQAAEKEMRDNSEAYRAARNRLADMNLHLWHPAPAKRTPQAIMDAAQRVKADIVIVDYTRRIKGWKPGNEANAMAEWFAEAAQSARVQLVILGQLKFKPGKYSGTRPTEDDVADSTQLPQEASRVIFLHRPFAGHKTRDTVTEVLGVKNRKGPLFTTHVTWFGETRSFYAMDEYEEAQCECCKPKEPKKKASTPDPIDTTTRDEEDRLLDEARTLFSER